MNSKNKRTLYLRWVGANGIGEMLGLGLTLAIGAIVITSLSDQQNSTTILVTFLVAVASGAIEATIVGLAQWWAMHPWFPMIQRTAWWFATLIGALVAYVLGYLPSTLMSLGEQTTQSQAPSAEPAQWVVLILAAGLGIVGGAVLSFAQWIVMRKKVARASLWMPANMLAWMVGMPIIFLGIDVTQTLSGMGWEILFMAGILLLTGLVVGAIHGAFLVHLALPEETPQIASG
ncbi:MAG: hypothetical protein A2Z71_07435 [Chloroflexi bacterium RBG_13_50_21]|nr:MAG: hypothetical protein A2Z71_07435 [Chloroflexi bacterium RBG_13_50_21]OGO64484.1 MAG: hypothetical protein A2029_14970 [Chloroflexi bacterium RBG_19FT_COMBO_47_9]